MDMVTGIKCDNIKCDFNDPTILYINYPEWINKPCPNCGENLLTQEDYDICAKMEMMSGIFEKMPGFKDLQNAFTSMFKGAEEDGLVSFDLVRNLFNGVPLEEDSVKEKFEDSKVQELNKNNDLLNKVKDKLKDRVLFPDRLEKLKESLKNIETKPEEIKKKKTRRSK